MISCKSLISCSSSILTSKISESLALAVSLMAVTTLIGYCLFGTSPIEIVCETVNDSFAQLRRIIVEAAVMRFQAALGDTVSASLFPSSPAPLSLHLYSFVTPASKLDRGRGSRAGASRGTGSRGRGRRGFGVGCNFSLQPFPFPQLQCPLTTFRSA
jgi:hypothetical protein